MIDSPRGWPEVEIGEICSLVNGRAFKPTEWRTEGLPIVRIQNLNNPAATFNHFDGDVSPRHRLTGGELLFAWSGTPGTSFGAHIWRGHDAVLNQHIFRVDFDETTIEKRFLRYAINQKLNELIGIAHGGVGLRHVTKGKFETTRVPLPPREDQERIADKLDALLAGIDDCREHLDRVPEILKRFRQSVLAAATSGELTREWREERGRDLAGWETTTVAALLEGKPRNGYSPRAAERPTPLKSLTLTATTTGFFRGEHHKYIDEEIPPDSHLWLVPGDILIQRANTLEYVGVSAVFDGPAKKFIYPDLMMKCRANSRIATPFLHYLLSSEPVRTYFRENATGTAGNMPKINQRTVLTAPAILPPLDEQQEIADRVATLFGRVARLKARSEATKAFVQEISPSALARAFRGEFA